MPYRQLFFIEGKLVGEGEATRFRVHEIFREPYSTLYFCPVCGDVWARCPTYKPDGGPTLWESRRVMCRKCALAHQRMFSEFPGCLWQPVRPEFNAALPVPVLRWELERHIENMERFPNGYE